MLRYKRELSGSDQGVSLVGGVIWLMDPKVFNFIIMGLYLMNAAWWGWHGKFADVCYWLSAFAITATVTFGYRH